MSVPPDISVVMSVYNGALYLRETVESVLAQQGVNLELVVVNDGSTDASGEILRRFAKEDARVVLIENENQGLTLSLIQGCLKANGRYIARQDVGDTSREDRLRLQQAALDQCARAAFVSSWTSYFGPEWEHLFTVKSRGKATYPINILPETSDNMLIDGPTSHPSVMFRKDIYERAGGYRPQFYFAQDFDLWLRLAQHGLFQMIELPLYHARITPTSLSPSNKKVQERIAKLAWDAFHARRTNMSEQTILRRAGSLRPSQSKSKSAHKQSQGYYFIGELLRKNNDGRALPYLSKAVRLFPFSIKPWVRLAQARFRTSNTSDQSAQAPQIES